jgi:putative ABC transport system permease protein
MALTLTYHWRSLFVRKTTTVLTVFVVAAVVAVFVWMIGFAAALQRSLSVAGDREKVIVIRRGATAESNSAIPVDEVGKLTQIAELATDESTGEPSISPEMVVQVRLPRLSDGGRTQANVAVRGLTTAAFSVHRNVRLPERVFSMGEPEIIVGRTAARQFSGLQVGDTLHLGYSGNRSYRVVGHFSAQGGPAESEIWGYLPSLMSSYNRTMYSSVALRLKPGADPNLVVQQIRDPAIQMDAETEADYWRRQSGVVQLYLRIAYVLITVMCIGAVFAIANTMYASVAGRTREIAMLRTIGFAPRNIVSGFILEAVLLSLIGGLVGCAACAVWLATMGNTKDMFGQTTFTIMAFEIHLSAWIVAAALGAVALVGVVGAFFPARRAGYTQVVTALREP